MVVAMRIDRGGTDESDRTDSPDPPKEAEAERGLPPNSDLVLPYMSRAAHREEIAALPDARPAGREVRRPDQPKEASETSPDGSPPRSEDEYRAKWEAYEEAIRKHQAENPRRLLGKPSEPESMADRHDTPAQEAPETRQKDADAKPADSTDKQIDKPEGREWRTLTEEFGEPREFRTFDAARSASIKEHGPRPGEDLHHIVERSQEKPTRSGFPAERIHSSDNLTWLDHEVHKEISKRYSRIIPGGDEVLRNALNGEPWEDQYDLGCEILDEELGRDRGDRND